MPWSFVAGNRTVEIPVSGPLIVNDFTALTVGIRSGVALGMLAEPTAEMHVANGELELVLVEQATSTTGLFLYYPSRAQVMPKLRAFIDFVHDQMARGLLG